LKDGGKEGERSQREFKQQKKMGTCTKKRGGKRGLQTVSKIFLCEGGHWQFECKNWGSANCQGTQDECASGNWRHKIVNASENTHMPHLTVWRDFSQLPGGNCETRTIALCRRTTETRKDDEGGDGFREAKIDDFEKKNHQDSTK